MKIYYSIPAGRSQRQRAFVLVAVLVVILLGSMVAMSLLFRLRADETAAAAGSSSEQAWAAAMSGVQEAIRVALSATPGGAEWQDNPKAFRDRLVHDDGSDRWYFTVYESPLEESLQELRYGLTDEASKLNLNASHTADLSKIPRLTPPLVQAIRDFIDVDLVARPEGAEQDFYDSLPRGYAVRNGPLNTVEELLLVRGFTPSLLYGEDLNMNHRLDANEDDGERTPPQDNGDGKLDVGLRSMFTTLSYDTQQDSLGHARTRINDSSDLFPLVELPAAVTNYVTLLRTHHIHVTHAADLLQARVTIQDDKGRSVEVESGIGKAELPSVLDHFTATESSRMEGLINANTASVAVLATLPGVDEALAEAIVSTRRSISPERRSTLAWLFQEDVVDAERFRALAPLLTSRPLQFHFQVVGFGVPSRRYRVLEVVIDLASRPATIRYLRDITRLGPPFRFDSVLEKEAIGG